MVVIDIYFSYKENRKILQCIPNDWNDGYDNVTVGCTIENQDRADYRLHMFADFPIKHRNVICKPLIEEINIEKYLDNVELVIVGGESDRNARPLNYN